MAASEMISFYNVQKVLEEYADNARELYGKNLALGGKRASGELIDTVRAQVVTGDKEYEVTLTLADYWKYVEGGTKGDRHPDAIYAQHRPPISAIMRWIEVKPIIPQPTATGKFPTPVQLAWAIAKGIETHGIAPHPALARTIEELNGMYAKRLGIALALDCEDYIAKIMPRTGSMSQEL